MRVGISWRILFGRCLLRCMGMQLFYAFVPFMSRMCLVYFAYLIYRICISSRVKCFLAVSPRISPICSFRGRGCRIIEVHFPIVLASIHAVLVAARRSFAAVVCAIHSFNVA